MTVLVTPAERELARLDLYLSKRLGEAPDPRMRKIAKAVSTPPSWLATGLHPGRSAEINMDMTAEDSARELERLRTARETFIDAVESGFNLAPDRAKELVEWFDRAIEQKANEVKTLRAEAPPVAEAPSKQTGKGISFPTRGISGR